MYSQVVELEKFVNEVIAANSDVNVSYVEQENLSSVKSLQTAFDISQVRLNQCRILKTAQ